MARTAPPNRRADPCCLQPARSAQPLVAQHAKRHQLGEDSKPELTSATDQPSPSLRESDGITTAPERHREGSGFVLCQVVRPSDLCELEVSDAEVPRQLLNADDASIGQIEKCGHRGGSRRTSVADQRRGERRRNRLWHFRNGVLDRGTVGGP